MSMEFINELIELICKYGEHTSGEGWEAWTCGDFSYIENDQFVHVSYKETDIFSQ